MAALYPLLLQAALHTRVWGGRKLATVMHKTLPDSQPYGEAWEMHDTAIVTNGAFAGQTVGELVKQFGADLVGVGNNPDEGMPLLVKILDAADWLSVQVHPDDDQAQALEGDPRGKTEAWIVLAADEGAKLVIGVTPGTDRAAMAEAIRAGTLENLLEYAQVQAGDVLYVQANTIHALGPGLLIYEIQQSSDVTYRLYDWNRMGLDGKPRPLHIEKGVQVSNVESLPKITHPEGDILVTGTYFTTWRHRLNDETRPLMTDGKFQAITCIEGSVTLTAGEHNITLTTGSTALVPACMGAFYLSGIGSVLRSSQ